MKQFGKQISMTTRQLENLSSTRSFMRFAIPMACLIASSLFYLGSALASPDRGCPSQFNQIKIPLDGKLCQIFAADYPASMVLFIPQTPEKVISHYLAAHPELTSFKQIKSRTILQTKDKNTTLVVSADGQGTQVDILVKAPVS
ncbi:hypothetical protein [Glaciecola sp. KUL10]|uniref:hypothetical protein n=1 Tax=Glaciecola sp. (strain KUL10) TaxID=2161813 RepID=UPI000D783857|nr:hypothetical protein [Glaciecola sp. KUL10]GBL04908.1 hypothetical protein KUL10_22230 [Glaciecola sp. KUL10]